MYNVRPILRVEFKAKNENRRVFIFILNRIIARAFYSIIEFKYLEKRFYCKFCKQSNEKQKTFINFWLHQFTFILYSVHIFLTLLAIESVNRQKKNVWKCRNKRKKYITIHLLFIWYWYKGVAILLVLSIYC